MAVLVRMFNEYIVCEIILMLYISYYVAASGRIENLLVRSGSQLL